MPRADFLSILRRIASKHDLDIKTFSHDWIIQYSDLKTDCKCSIFGYTFDLNPAGAVEICRDKSATSDVLAAHSVPHISHTVFLSPGNQLTAEFVARKGNWKRIQDLVDKIGFPAVLKPLKGTGGIGVVKAKCWREVEGAIQTLFSEDYGLAISPYKRVVDEYRCICLDGKVELIYRKVRNSVIGDGKTSVAALIGARLSCAAEHEVVAVFHAVCNADKDELSRVPGAGELVPLQWKHNLGQGATVDMDIAADMSDALAGIALQAARAVGVRFCSVDVVSVEEEGLMLMEVNGGVMMDSLITLLGAEGPAKAEAIYEAAVLGALTQKCHT